MMFDTTPVRGRHPRHLALPAVACIVASLALALALSACGSSSGSAAGSTATSGGSSAAGASSASGEPAWLAQAKARIRSLMVVPTVIASASLGKFTPPAKLSLYYVGTPPVAEGIQNFGKAAKAAAAVLGYSFKSCTSATPDGTSLCFDEAIDAKPNVILTAGTSQIANGQDWAKVKAAGIPMIAAFAGDPQRSPDLAAEIAGGAHCYDAGVDLADGIIAGSDGKANIVLFNETSFACNVATTQGFQAEISKCTTCKTKLSPYSVSTMSTTFPQQITAAIEQNPQANWMASTFDTGSQLVSAGVRQSGRTNIQVGGVYGFSPNLADVRNGSQAFDIMHGHSEWGWMAVDAAARIVAGQKIPYNLEPTLFDYTKQTESLVGNFYDGPKNYQEQFKALWGK
jgi:ribose transport system substrate-binding protein